LEPSHISDLPLGLQQTGGSSHSCPSLTAGQPNETGSNMIRWNDFSHTMQITALILPQAGDFMFFSEKEESHFFS